MEKIISVDREIRVGSNRIFLDRDNILYYINVGEVDEEIARKSVYAMKELKDLATGKVNFLVDLNQGGKTTSKAREILRKFTENYVEGKLALYGVHPVARVLASFFMGLIPKRDMRFFSTREKAMEWLKGTEMDQIFDK